MLNWDDLNFFGAIASERSFRRAAARLNLSVNTIRSRVDRLEQALGMNLFHRGRDGLSLSADGVAALGIVLEMEATSRRLAPRDEDDAKRAGNTLTICCTEGVGEYWLAPRLPSLRQQVGANIAFLCDSDQDRIHSAERDVCIGFARPTYPETIVCKVATLHFVLCGSKCYFERFGRPKSIDELDGHRILVHEAYGLSSAALKRLAGEERARHLIAARMNGTHALVQAIRAGYGIGALPTYLSGLSEEIEPLDLRTPLETDLWLSFNRSNMMSQVSRDAIDWIKGCFRPADYPWFGEEFIHPRNFRADRNGASPGPEAFVDPMVPAAGIEPAAP